MTNLLAPSASGSRVELELSAVHLDIQQGHETILSRMDATSNLFEGIETNLAAVRRTIDQSHRNLAAVFAEASPSHRRIEAPATPAQTTQQCRGTHIGTQEEYISEVKSAVHAPGFHEAGSIQEIAPICEDEDVLSAHHPWRQPNDMNPMLSVHLRPRRSLCANQSCSCLSHSKRVRLHTPLSLMTLLGCLFVGYSGYPIREPKTVKRENSLCLQRSRFCVEVIYIFPAWFLRSVLYSIFEISPGGRPAFGLTIRRRTMFETGNILDYSDKGDTAAVQHLISKEPGSVDDQCELNGCTALHYAIQRCRIDTIKVLLRAGANPDAEDDFGRNARQLAFIGIQTRLYPPDKQRQLEQIFPWSTTYIEDLELTIIHKSVLNIVSIDLSTIFSANDATINEQVHCKDALGYTPLQWAVRLDNVAAVRELLRIGARPDTQNNMGATPLTNAMVTAKASCVKTLIDAGADPCAANKNGIQPMHFACLYKHLEAVKLLLESGADVNCRAVDGLTPLLLASRWGAVDILEYLLDHGADVEQGNFFEDTPLFFAVIYNSHGSLRFLLSRKANHRHVSKAKKTVLHLVAEMGDVETMEILAEAKLKDLDVNARDLDGKIASQIFAQRDLLWEGIEAAFGSLMKSIEFEREECEVGSDEEAVFFAALEYL